MKQMKIFLVAVMALVMGVSVTSCMKGDDNNTQILPAIVEVTSSLGFSSMTTLEGYTIQPTNTTIEKAFPSSTKMGYIYYSFDPTSEANLNYQTTKKVSAELQYATSIDNTVVVTTKGASNDSVGNSSIKSITNVIDIATNTKKFTIKNKKAILGLDYFMSKKEHYTSLVCYEEEMTPTATDLVLYMRNNTNGDDKSTSLSSYNYYQSGYIPFYIKAFDLYSAIQKFKSSTGKNPANIVIKASVNNNDLELTDELTSFSVAYTE